MRVPLFDFEANIIQISRLADADLAEGCSTSLFARFARSNARSAKIFMANGGLLI